METNTTLQQRNFEQLSNAVRYYRCMTSSFHSYLNKKILEVGCGEGNITANLLESDTSVIGIDLNEMYLATIRNRFAGNAHFSAEASDITRPEDVKALSTKQIDTIIAVNVIEHIAWLIMYKWLKRVEPGKSNVKFLETLVPFFCPIERLISPPFGLSVVAIGQKKI